MTQVSESRSSAGNNRIALSLGVSGDGLPATAIIRQVTVTKAVDNTGRVLAPSNMGAASSLSSVGNVLTNPQPVMRATASLGGVPRAAESIKYVEGTIEIYMPTEANGSMIRIPGIKRNLGRVEHPVLAKYGIAFHFVADRESNREAQRLLAAVGNGNSSTNGADPNGITSVAYYFRDPSGKLAGHHLVDKSGATIRNNGGTGIVSPNGSYWMIGLQTPLPEDAQLMLFFANDEAIRKVPFRVEEIALP